jgi:type I restriction enzyme S subunit
MKTRLSPKGAEYVSPNGAKYGSGYKQTEIGIIPEDWEDVTFKDICWVNQGLQIPISQRLTFPTKNSKVYITIQYLNGGKILEYIDDYAQSVCCNIDDVLMTRTGNTGIVVSGVEGVFHNNFFKINFDKKIVNKDYLIYYLIQPKTKQIILAKAGTSTIPDLNHKDFYSIPIPLPQLPEQTAIAEALSDTDELITTLQKLIENKKLIKKGTMQELLTGKTRLLSPNGAQHTRGMGASPFPHQPHKMKQTEIGLIPVDWDVKRLGECLIESPKYGMNAAAVPYSDTLPTYVRITDITESGRIDKNKKVSVNNPFSDNYYLSLEDIVVARTGASVGKSYLYNPNDGKLVFAGFLIKLSPNNKILLSKFLKSIMETAYFWNWVKVMSTRSGQPGINGNEYASLKISLPSLPEQTAIAETLTDMDSEIEMLEKKLEKTKYIKQGMMQELLTGKTRLSPEGAQPNSPERA